MSTPPLILQALRQPETLPSLNLAEWDLLLRQARQGVLLPRLHSTLSTLGLLEQVPPQARQHLEWAHAMTERHAQAVRWEVRMIRQALRKVDTPIILLKGAAYVMAGLPAAHGRLFSDIDIMVPKQSLNAVEAALMLHGWATSHHDAYDQRYYRKWMHELPPMQHVSRATVIDVHHAILPETARVHPDSEKLRAAARDIDGQTKLQVLAPTDMVLHSAAHLFHEGEWDKSLRDLTDLDSLLRHFGSQPTFWPELVARAKELELSRTLFYALRYCTTLLHTPVPPETLEASQAGAPNRLLCALMDGLFHRALLPIHPSCSDGFSQTARRLLYIRANWLRMPPLMLARHLLHKAFVSPRDE